MSDQELIIVRGLPGSGKSTFAKTLESLHNHAVTGTDPYYAHIEADMFFMAGGAYQFNPSLIPQAHTWCQEFTLRMLSLGNSCIVSNTFSRVKEMQPYIDMAEEFLIRLTVIEVQGDHGNLHNVPPETTNKMKARWEKYP